MYARMRDILVFSRLKYFDLSESHFYRNYTDIRNYKKTAGFQTS